MASDRRVPFAGLYVLPGGTLLEIQIAGAVKYVQMHNGMEQHGASMTFAAGGLADDCAVSVNDREYFR